jgi:hypothetical protein
MRKQTRKFTAFWMDQFAHEKNKENSVKRHFRNNRNEDRGDISIRGLWARGTDCVIDLRVTYADAKSSRSKIRPKV